MPTTFICENGHKRESHRSQPHGHGQKPICRECKADIIRRSVELWWCKDCDHSWPYTGDADRPTCPSCKGKRTEAIEADPNA